ncbi:hypothetical protein OG792_12010 [Micromonospora sp. NBC_01699]|uniref:hypothetical protein n=1 Tax=Micromonospora sp. NBC_01699 TaxID=2975984 RepID=UPI002E321166|nr:hypothetical protein [Micromonospora sp. NBC_01699]
MRLRKPSRVSRIAATFASATFASVALASPVFASTAPQTAPASAGSCSYGKETVCFSDSIWFTGNEVEFSSPFGVGCVNSPIAIHSHVNLTDRTLLLFPGTNCTGSAITVPAGDLHSHSTALRSFRVA